MEGLARSSYAAWCVGLDGDSDGRAVAPPPPSDTAGPSSALPALPGTAGFRPREAEREGRFSNRPSLNKVTGGWIRMESVGGADRKKGAARRR